MFGGTCLGVCACVRECVCVFERGTERERERRLLGTCLASWLWFLLQKKASNTPLQHLVLRPRRRTKHPRVLHPPLSRSLSRSPSRPPQTPRAPGGEHLHRGQISKVSALVFVLYINSLYRGPLRTDRRTWRRAFAPRSLRLSTFFDPRIARYLFVGLSFSLV